MRNIRRAVVSIVLASVALVGCASHEASEMPTQTVDAYNEGFAESKVDDCEQGFQPACDWIANNK
ncbi:hypothetical protein ACFWOT_09025 [Streptomyces sp. NPDC058440]|uniref:hypothetical protein n=1 Tax=Streptomyces sp. NPDC058440 TaxID=3346501 RepID=UPI00364FEF89